MKYLIIVLLLITVIPVLADDEGEFGGEDAGSDLGGAAVGLLFLGTTYILAKHGLRLLKSVLEPDDYEKWRLMYKDLRPYLFMSHVWLNIAATVLATLHGISLLSSGGITMWTGAIALSAMIIATVLGSIIWWKFKPVWQNKDARRFIRMIHRQWTVSAVLVIALFLHLVLGGD